MNLDGSSVGFCSVECLAVPEPSECSSSCAAFLGLDTLFVEKERHDSEAKVL